MRTLLRSVVVVAALLLTGCSAGSGASGDAAMESSDGGADQSAGDVATEGEVTEESAPGQSASDEDKQFVTQGSISMIVDNPAKAVVEAARLVESVGGHISERVEQGSTEDEFASAYLVVRIPSDQVTDTVEDLKSLGEVQEASLTSTEVTDQVTDLAARIRALEISITRLEDLLGRSGSIEEIVEAERVLTERQSDLEVLLSQQKALADDVSLAIFRIDMWTPESEPEPEAPTATGFWPGLVAGWNALVSTINGLLQVIGALIPWLVFAALVTAVVVAIMRRFGRRKASTMPPSAPSPVPFGAGPTTSLPPTGAAAPQPEPEPAGAPLGGATGAEVAPDPSSPPPPRG
jgi:hypothetical protein